MVKNKILNKKKHLEKLKGKGFVDEKGTKKTVYQS